MKKGIKVLFTLMIIVLSFTFATAKTSYKCETVDGAYYGKDGKEVDKVQYDKECLAHTCEIVGDTYYGSDGKEVTQGVFENQCNTTVVSELPDTASASNIIYLIVGSAFILGTLIVSISYRIVSDRA